MRWNISAVEYHIWPAFDIEPLGLSLIPIHEVCWVCKTNLLCTPSRWALNAPTLDARLRPLHEDHLPCKFRLVAGIKSSDRYQRSKKYKLERTSECLCSNIRRNEFKPGKDVHHAIVIHCSAHLVILHIIPDHSNIYRYLPLPTILCDVY